MYGEKIKKNIITSDKRVVKLAKAIQKRGFTIIAHSDGLILDDDFLCPCVVAAPCKQPLIRYENEVVIFKDFIKGTKLKSLDDFDRKNLNKYFKLLDQEKETLQFKLWRERTKSLASKLKGEIRKFNFKIKEADQNLFVSLMSFEDGTIRIDFGDQRRDKPRKKFSKLSPGNKKLVLEKMLNHFSDFTIFLKRGNK